MTFCILIYQTISLFQCLKCLPYLVLLFSFGDLLLLNEVHFGPNAFVEILIQEAEEMAADIAQPFHESHIIIAKRIRNSHVHVDAIIDMSNMQRTHDNYILVTTINQQDVPSSTTNTMTTPGNTIFAMGITVCS